MEAEPSIDGIVLHSGAALADLFDADVAERRTVHDWPPQLGSVAMDADRLVERSARRRVRRRRPIFDQWAASATAAIRDPVADGDDVRATV